MKTRSKVTLGAIGGLLLLCSGIYFLLGIFVIQPIGAIPNGITIVYLRSNTDFPFVSSADGLLLERTGSVSLLSRSVMLGSALEKIGPNEVVRLPYMSFLYSISTGGVELDR